MPHKIREYPFLLPLLVLVLGINIYFRAFPIYFPQLKTRAKEVINNVVNRNAAFEVYKKFPQFNPIAKDKIIKTRVSEYKRLDAKGIKEQINEGWRQLKSRFQDDSGQTYLMELDCWHWSRYVDNVLKHGYPGDIVRDGKQIDLFMLAPLGSPLHWEHSLYYLSAFLYKAFSFFKKVPLFTFTFYLPLLFSAIFLALLYLFSFRLSGHIGAWVSCLVMGLSPIFLQRSCAGWFDKDILSLIFPTLVIWTYVSSGDKHSLKAKILWIFLSGLFTGLFAYTWTHWWFIFAILIIYEAIFILFLAFAHFYLKRQSLVPLKEHALSLALFIIFSFFWTVIFCGLEPLDVLYKQLMLALILNKPLMASIWPNVYSTVGELRTLGIREIANSMGGMFIFTASSLSLAVLLVISFADKRYAGYRRNTVLILAIWTLSMLFAATRGIRFVLFLPFSLGISLGWVLNEIFAYFKKRKNLWAVSVVLCAILIFSGMIMKRAYAVSSSIYPLMNDTWYKVLTLIKDKTKEGTIVNSWWDFGDWFKAIAKRPAIFDGQSQDSPQAYWMAKALLSSNEEEAVGILRMLNNSGNKAFETIDSFIHDPLESALLLERLITLSPYDAQEALKKFIPAQLAQEVLGMLYSRPPPACFVVDDTMIPKMAAISYLGTWDFSKVYIAQNFDKLEKEQIMQHLKGLGRNIDDMQRYYQEVFLIKPQDLNDWLSNRVLFYGDLVSGKEKDGMIFFDNGFIYNPKNQTIRSSAGQIPFSLFVLTGDSFVEINLFNANSAFSALVVNQKGQYKCILLDRQLGASMFVRLYFFRGLGLRHFSPLIDAEEGNDYIRVFNINW
jgi:asparagine N-glycosylation enzyme membrane subunit Stt3